MRTTGQRLSARTCPSFNKRHLDPLPNPCGGGGYPRPESVLDDGGGDLSHRPFCELDNLVFGHLEAPAYVGRLLFVEVHVKEGKDFLGVLYGHVVFLASLNYKV